MKNYKKTTLEASSEILDVKRSEYEKRIELRIMECERRLDLKIFHGEVIRYYLLLKKELKKFLKKEKYLSILEMILEIYELHDKIEDILSESIEDQVSDNSEGEKEELNLFY